MGEYIQSNKLISQALAMITENRAVRQILSTLLGAGGADLQLFDANRYVREGEETCFMVAVKRAQQMGEIALGFVENRQACMNPKNKLDVRRWDDIMFVAMVRASEGGPTVAEVTPDKMEVTDPSFAKNFDDVGDRLGDLCRDLKQTSHAAHEWLAENKNKSYAPSSRSSPKRPK